MLPKGYYKEGGHKTTLAYYYELTKQYYKESTVVLNKHLCSMVEGSYITPCRLCHGLKMIPDSVLPQL